MAGEYAGGALRVEMCAVRAAGARVRARRQMRRRAGRRFGLRHLRVALGELEPQRRRQLGIEANALRAAAGCQSHIQSWSALPRYGAARGSKTRTRIGRKRESSQYLNILLCFLGALSAVECYKAHGLQVQWVSL